MSDIDDVIEQQRERLKRKEREAVRDLIRAYQDVERRLLPLIDELVNELRSTPEPTLGMVFRSKRYQALLRQVRAELAWYATTTVGPTTDRTSRVVAGMVIDDTQQLILAGMGDAPDGAAIEATFTRLPTEAIETIVGTTRSGPLADLLLGFGNAAAERARQSLVTGMAFGWHPTKIARELRRSLGVSRSRAALIARTEINRAHRETSRASYRSNDHIVTGYVWRAACDSRTCVACWAMHGTEFPLDTPMGAHPACRCALIPKTKTWRELGFTTDIPETSFTSPSGSDLFRTAPASTQRAVLGPRAYEAYRNGEVDIADFVKIRQSPKWGVTYTRGSLAYARMRHGT